MKGLCLRGERNECDQFLDVMRERVYRMAIFSKDMYMSSHELIDIPPRM